MLIFNVMTNKDESRWEAEQMDYALEKLHNTIKIRHENEFEGHKCLFNILICDEMDEESWAMYLLKHGRFCDYVMDRIEIK